MSNNSPRQPRFSVGRPVKRAALTMEPLVPLDGPVNDGPLIHVRGPLRRVALTFEPVAAGDAKEFIRRRMVSPDRGRPLEQLVAIVIEAVRVATGAVTPAAGIEATNAVVLRRLFDVLNAVHAENPDAALDPELFEALRLTLLLWAVGGDLGRANLTDSFRHQPQALLSPIHQEVFELLQALAF